ncbi:hypothetical protein GQ607_011983 [Colletotrichum asianum]|uniref:Uncharacterized protein n=1 Tax=Colletotrichum asianum TaxID=702518 RepID=A0A8H3W592_9PEZI|nr:hypothetical protein GQ607_011983 [Colletotrichum asianum]
MEPRGKSSPPFLFVFGLSAWERYDPSDLLASVGGKTDTTACTYGHGYMHTEPRKPTQRRRYRNMRTREDEPPCHQALRPCPSLDGFLRKSSAASSSVARSALSTRQNHGPSRPLTVSLQAQKANLNLQFVSLDCPGTS